MRDCGRYVVSSHIGRDTGGTTASANLLADWQRIIASWVGSREGGW